MSLNESFDLLKEIDIFSHDHILDLRFNEISENNCTLSQIQNNSNSNSNDKCEISQNQFETLINNYDKQINEITNQFLLLENENESQRILIESLEYEIMTLKAENLTSRKRANSQSQSSNEALMVPKAKSSRMAWEEKEINDLISLSEQFKKNNKTDWSKIIKNHADKFKPEHLDSKILAGQLSIVKKQRTELV